MQLAAAAIKNFDYEANMLNKKEMETSGIMSINILQSLFMYTYYIYTIQNETKWREEDSLFAYHW